jgi:hypothetical protein
MLLLPATATDNDDDDDDDHNECIRTGLTLPIHLFIHFIM